MKNIIYFFRVLMINIIINYQAEILGYYNTIEEIPIYNWAKIEEGKYEYLFKGKKGKVPEFFPKIITDMFFQFETINMEMIEKKHRLAYLKNLYLTTKRVDYLMKYRHLEAQIKQQESKKQNKSTLNEKINFIETVFSSIGSIDVHQMSASRFYSLYNAAIKKVENANNSKK